jgi:hypothetical protein
MNIGSGIGHLPLRWALVNQTKGEYIHQSFVQILVSLNVFKETENGQRTRSVTDQKLFIPNVRLAAFKNSIFVICFQFYSDLNIDFRSCKKLSALRNVLKSCFINSL